MTLGEALRLWWASRRSFDAVDPRASSSALFRSAKIQAAAADLPKINRCPGCPERSGGAFVQRPGELCDRCAIKAGDVAAQPEARIVSIRRRKP